MCLPGGRAAAGKSFAPLFLVDSRTSPNFSRFRPASSTNHLYYCAVPLFLEVPIMALPRLASDRVVCMVRCVEVVVLLSTLALTQSSFIPPRGYQRFLSSPATSIPCVCGGSNWQRGTVNCSDLGLSKGPSTLPRVDYRHGGAGFGGSPTEVLLSEGLSHGRRRLGVDLHFSGDKQGAHVS